MKEYNRPELSVDSMGDSARFSPVAVAGVYIYVGALTTVAVEVVAAVHAGTVLWTGAWFW